MGRSRQQKPNNGNKLFFHFQWTKPVPLLLFEFDCGGWVKPHQGGQTFWVFRMSRALNGRGEVTASDPKPKQRLTGLSSRWQPFESKRFCLYLVWKLRWQHWRSQVVQTARFFRQEDNRWDFGCWLNCSNWRLNEFTELTGRGWANEVSPPGGRRSHWEGGPLAARMCRNSAGNPPSYQEINTFEIAWCEHDSGYGLIINNKYVFYGR